MWKKYSNFVMINKLLLIKCNSYKMSSPFLHIKTYDRVTKNWILDLIYKFEV